MASSCSTKVTLPLFACFNLYTFQSKFSLLATWIKSFPVGLNRILSLNSSGILPTSNALKLTVPSFTYPELGRGLYLLSCNPWKLTFAVLGHILLSLTPLGFLRNLDVSSMSIKITSSSLASGVISYSLILLTCTAISSSVVALILNVLPGKSP